jgi:hypothetical protein
MANCHFREENANATTHPCKVLPLQTPYLPLLGLCSEDWLSLTLTSCCDTPNSCQSSVASLVNLRCISTSSAWTTRDSRLPLRYATDVEMQRRLARHGVREIARRIGRAPSTVSRELRRHLVLGGQPLREPIATYGPFVMNADAEIAMAFDDYGSGRLGQIPADQIAPRRFS